MIIKDLNDGKLIILSRPFDTRPKILNSVYFIVFTALAVFLFNMGFSAMSSLNIVGVLFLLALIFVYLLIGYRFINKALQTEKLVATKEYFTIVKTGLLNKKEHRYQNRLISKFRHLDKPQLTRHPISGNTFEYTGFEIGQKGINEMHGDNRLAFDYNGKTVTFGENVYSWEFEELENLLYSITGSYYVYDNSFEKTFSYDEDNELKQNS